MMGGAYADYKFGGYHDFVSGFAHAGGQEGPFIYGGSYGYDTNGYDIKLPIGDVSIRVTQKSSSSNTGTIVGAIIGTIIILAIIGFLVWRFWPAIKRCLGIGRRRTNG